MLAPQSWNNTVPQTSQRKHATACLLPVWILITKQFSFVSLINFCLFYFCSHSDVLSKVSATSPVPPFPFSQLSHEILLCLGVCFLKSLCVFCLKQTLSDHPTYYALHKGHALCTERKALLFWLRNNKLDRHWKQGFSPRVQDSGKMFHSGLQMVIKVQLLQGTGQPWSQTVLCLLQIFPFTPSNLQHLLVPLSRHPSPPQISQYHRPFIQNT